LAALPPGWSGPLSCANASLQITNRIVANSSMWTQGHGAVQSSSRTMKGSDVLVVVMNESSVELDTESSAFVESGDLDVTVRLPPSMPHLPNSQRVLCPSSCVVFVFLVLHQRYLAYFIVFAYTSRPVLRKLCFIYWGSSGHGLCKLISDLPPNTRPFEFSSVSNTQVPCNQRLSCASCEPSYRDGDCKWFLTHSCPPVPVNSYTLRPGARLTTTIQFLAFAQRLVQQDFIQ
jgi:hypothetical protein